MMLQAFGDLRSGNCYKVWLLARYLDLDLAWTHVDVLVGGARTPDFLARNPNGKVPTLQLADGSHLWESNAILCHLADGSAFMPKEPLNRARVLQWLFWEQYSHEPYIAVARFIALFQGMPEARREEFAAKQAGGQRALALMDDHLEARDFFVGDHVTVADIALYAYTHVAGDGGFDLAAFPAIGAWIDRIEHRPGHMTLGAAVTRSG